jgi:hypothetical protein
MLVMGDNEQSLAPSLAGAQAVVDIGNQLFSKRDHRRRMLVIFRMAEVGKVLGFDERIGR